MHTAHVTSPAPTGAGTPVALCSVITLTTSDPTPSSRGVPSFFFQRDGDVIGRLFWREYEHNAGWQFVAARRGKRVRKTHGWIVDALIKQGDLSMDEASEAMLANADAECYSTGPL